MFLLIYSSQNIFNFKISFQSSSKAAFLKKEGNKGREKVWNILQMIWLFSFRGAANNSKVARPFYFLYFLLPILLYTRRVFDQYTSFILKIPYKRNLLNWKRRGLSKGLRWFKWLIILDLSKIYNKILKIYTKQSWQSSVWPIHLLHPENTLKKKTS